MIRNMMMIKKMRIWIRTRMRTRTKRMIEMNASNERTRLNVIVLIFICL